MIPVLHSVLDSPELQERFKKSTFRNLQLSSLLVKLLQLFDQNKIEALSFKGPVLATMLYGDVAQRQFRDLDILIHEKDIVQSMKLLEAEGFQPDLELSENQKSKFLRTQCEFTFRRKRHEIVEIHWAFAPKHYLFAYDVDSLWNRLAKISFAGTTISTIPPEDLFVILSAHGSKHFWQRLGWIFDIATFIQKFPGTNWESVWQLAQRCNCERLVLLATFLANQLFLVEIPDLLLKKIDSSVKFLAKQVCDWLYGNQAAPEPEATFHSFHLRGKVGFANQFEYCVRAATTPSIDDWNWIALPSSVSGAYYLLRPIRLSGKYLHRMFH
jgi:hypothetical protein